ncbi:MAG TPA: hypothetical protein VJI69_00400 [Bacteroidia bacterium]|nr:hypothetical protein [Bacteroidia bacterium]
MNKNLLIRAFVVLTMLLLLSNNKLTSQNIAINATGAASVASAMLDITSTTSGLLVPRMTAAQRAAIAAPATSLLVYQTDAGAMGIGFYFYNGTAWVPFGTNNGGWGLLGNTGTVSGTNFIGTIDAVDFTVRTTNVERMRVLAAGNVGIGTTIPRSQMHINGAAGAATAYRITNSTTANAAATDGFKMEIPSASSSVVLSNQENANIQFNTNNAFRAVYFNDGTYWHGGAGGPAFDTDEFDCPAGELAGVGSVWGLNPSPAANGTGYGTANINYSVLGMIGGTRQYSMGIAGQTVNVNRCGAVFGMSGAATAWGTLGYRSSAGAQFGAYFSAAAGSGAGFSTTNATAGTGMGIYSDFLGSLTKGEVIGQISIGELFASYNLGNEFTSGYKADIVKGDNGGRTIAFSNSSTELKIYSDGSSSLSNGEVFVKFEDSFINLFSKGSVPTITISPMGECNGLFISKVEQNGFWVRELNNGHSNVLFSWIAIGKRIDNIEIPKDLLDIDFDKNLSSVIVNENNPEIEGKPMWWNGSKIIFNQAPPDGKPVGKMKTVVERAKEQISTR